MINEQWIKWEPIKNLAPKYYIESITDSREGFSILLFDANNREKKVLVSFPNSVESYRSIDESFVLNSLYKLNQNYGRDFYGDWTFFIIENSEYLDWLSTESYKISEKYKLIHYCLLSADSRFDIINNVAPEVTHINAEKH